MKRFKLFMVMLFMLFASMNLFANPSVTSNGHYFLGITDTGSDTDPADTYSTGVDGYASAAFRGENMFNKKVVFVATTLDTLSGTNVTHLTPYLQVSGDGESWANVDSLGTYASPTFTSGNVNSVDLSWTIIADLTDYYVPYVRIVYVLHTAAGATVSNAANLGGEQAIQTEVYVPKN